MSLVNVYVVKRTGELRRGVNLHYTQLDADISYDNLMGKGETWLSRLCTLSVTETYGIPCIEHSDHEQAQYDKYMQELEAEANGNQTTHDHDHGNDAGHSD